MAELHYYYLWYYLPWYIFSVARKQSYSSSRYVLARCRLRVLLLLYRLPSEANVALLYYCTTTSELRVLLLHEYVPLPCGRRQKQLVPVITTVSVVVGRTYCSYTYTKINERCKNRYVKAFIKQMKSLVRSFFREPPPDVSVHDSLVRRTLATSPRLI